MSISEEEIAEAIALAERISDPVESNNEKAKPRLRIEKCDPDRTVAAFRDILARHGGLYERGVPVRLVSDESQQSTSAHIMTPDGIVHLAHIVSRPYVVKTIKNEVTEEDAPFPRPMAVMYLDWRGEWRLPPLNGIASAPLLREDGSVRTIRGYDPVTGMWCEKVPDLTKLLPERPTKADAELALHRLRDRFKTFCFADAEMIIDQKSELAVVDTSKPPGRDESSFLNALLAAVCRPSLHLAPGVLFRAAPVSGAGAGKGLLARCICMIAFGREPHAVTAGGTADELEKRIAAELIAGSPVLFLDNLNNTVLKSNLLASAIKERPARVRLLGKSQMMPLNPSALVILTGNGVTLSEDLVRRFLLINFDARTEDPEARPFTNDILAEVTEHRAELLAALLTIWRWGRQSSDIGSGLPLGSFGQWCRYVRDPLLALGCQDPVERVSEAKENDARRQETADLFATWWEKHGDQPVKARDLDETVRRILDPQGRSPNFIVARLIKLSGTRLAGFVLTQQGSPGKWGPATYALKPTASQSHWGHRGDRADHRSNAPYAPYASLTGGSAVDAETGIDQPQPSPLPAKLGGLAWRKVI